MRLATHHLPAVVIVGALCSAPIAFVICSLIMVWLSTLAGNAKGTKVMLVLNGFLAYGGGYFAICCR